MYEEIAKQIKMASLDRTKSAMFHFQVLKHADSLAGVNAVEFCRQVGMPDSFAIEFRKMLNVAQVMKQQKVEIKASPE